MAQNFRVPVGLFSSASDPTVPSPAAGDIYYNSSANEIRVYNGTAWVAVGGGGAVDANNLIGTTLASTVTASSLTSFGYAPTLNAPSFYGTASGYAQPPLGSILPTIQLDADANEISIGLRDGNSSSPHLTFVSNGGVSAAYDARISVTGGGSAVNQGTMTLSASTLITPTLVAINSTSPNIPLQIGSSSTIAAGSPSVILSGNNNTERIAIRSSVEAGVFLASRSLGTIASPSAVTSSTPLGVYQFGGYDGTQYIRSSWIRSLATENWSSSARGSDLTFATTPNGSTTIADRMTISHDGVVNVTGSLTVATVPVVTTTATQTLTNKTLQGATFNNSAVTISSVPVTGIDNPGQVNNLQVFQSTNAAGADSFITFHNSGTYAIHFGLNRATNRLAWGGWSAGANKYTIYSSADLLPNSALQNSSITINGTAVSLGGSATVGASAATQTVLGTVFGLTQNGVNTSIGYQTANIPTSNFHNVAIGFQAGQNNTTGGSVTIGYQAMKTGTGIGFAIAIGYNALWQTTGSNGFAIGTNAGAAAGNWSNAPCMIGNNAGSSGTAVNQCTIIGNSAGNLATNLNNNTFIGFEAGRGEGFTAYNTSSGNIYIGRQAGYRLGGSGGGNNIAIGDGSQYGWDTTSNRSSNVSVGHNALNSVQTGSSNVAFGGAAGRSISTGSNNTCIGHSAGYDFAGTPLTTGSNNIIIGYLAMQTTASVSNQITLGNSSITQLRCQVTSITALSDARDKTNVIDIPIGLDFINALRPVVFEWDIRKVYDEEGNEIPNANNGTRHGGFIAQELAEIEDSYEVTDWLALVYRDNPDKLEAAPAKLLPVMVKAIQELSAKVAELEARL